MRPIKLLNLRQDVVAPASAGLDQLATGKFKRTDRRLTIPTIQAGIEFTVIDLERSRARLAEFEALHHSVQTALAEAALAKLIASPSPAGRSRILIAVSRETLGLARAERAKDGVLRFRILRPRNDGMHQIAATAATPLRPNDGLEVFASASADRSGNTCLCSGTFQDTIPN